MGKTQLKREYELLESLGDSSLKITINGNCIENLIEGFKIYNITGRDLLTREASIEGGGGSSSYVKFNNFTGRTITVEFILEGRNNTDLMRKAEKLNAYLFTKKDVDIFFNDDKYKYIGQVARVNTTDRTIDTIIAKMDIFCSDFKKYGEIINIPNKGSETEIIFNYDFLNDIIPEIIELKVLLNTNRIEIENLSNDKKIRLRGISGAFRGGDIIKIYPKKQEIRKGSQNLLKHLHLESNLEDFNIKYGDIVKVVTRNATMKLTFREERI